VVFAGRPSDGTQTHLLAATDSRANFDVQVPRQVPACVNGDPRSGGAVKLGLKQPESENACVRLIRKNKNIILQCLFINCIRVVVQVRAKWQ
jgi:hypothetical protein